MKALLKIVVVILLFPFLWIFGSAYLFFMLLKGIYAAITSR